MPVEDMFMGTPESEPQTTPEITPEAAQPVIERTPEAPTSPEAVESTAPKRVAATDEQSKAYYQRKYQEAKSELKKLQAFSAIAGQPAQQPMDSPPVNSDDIPYEDQLVAKITQSVTQQLTGVQSQREYETQLKSTASDIEKWAKDNDLEEIMPDVYEFVSTIDAPLQAKVQMIKDIALGRASSMVIGEIESSADARAEQKLERKLTHTLPKDSATPPTATPQSQDQRDWELAKIRGGVNPIIDKLFG